MKKKLMTVLLSTVMVLGATGTAFADTGKDCIVKVWELGNWLGYFNSCNISLPELNFKDETDQNIDEIQTQQPEQEAGSKAEQVLNLVNKERAKAGVSLLKEDGQLNRLAQLKAEDMAKKGYFSHTSPTYGSAFDMMKAAGVSYRTAGENIAKGQKSPETVMNGWMNSSGHRANILENDYTRLGVGYAVAENGTTYWVQIFAG